MRELPLLRGNKGQAETVVLAIIGLALLIGLVTHLRDRRTEIMASWVGHHQSELIASWGPPNRIMPDGKGGTVLDYSHYKDLGQRGYIDRRGNIYTYPRGYQATRLFYVDSDGIIYNFKWKGL